MDKATPIGFLVGFAAVLGAIVFEGGVQGIAAFLDVPGMMVCFGGSFAAAMVAFPIGNIMALPKTVMHIFKVKTPNLRNEIKRFAEYAAVVRRDGLLGLEAKLPDVQDPFLKRGLEMVIDNATKEKLHEVLEIEIEALHERHTTGKKIFENMGAMAPAFGMVGTLIGLIQMLGSLEDPSKIGAGMAVAMVTTFYGAFLSNMIFLPIATKLETRSREEVAARQMMLQGLIGLVEGENPRELEGKLKAFLSPKYRQEQVDTLANAA
ncbi:MAG: motility protein A [Gemmataceae bacterium]|jgi:chemotaxis protein MotA|nr:motility protein A [Gemmataceae bacterium]